MSDDSFETPGAYSLPDYLRDGLRVVSIGLNPSMGSVAAGYYFANPRNRFWQALNRSRLVGEDLLPGQESVEHLFRVHGIGFTDVVKRPTRSASAIRREDFRRGAVDLHEKILLYRPPIAWFHGMIAWRNQMKFGEGITGPANWGAQDYRIGETRVFVTPNPSPANAAYSLEIICRCYAELKAFIETA